MGGWAAWCVHGLDVGCAGGGLCVGGKEPEPPACVQEALER